jgi:hypothetical protein
VFSGYATSNLTLPPLLIVSPIHIITANSVCTSNESYIFVKETAFHCIKVHCKLKCYCLIEYRKTFRMIHCRCLNLVLIYHIKNIVLRRQEIFVWNLMFLLNFNLFISADIRYFIARICSGISVYMSLLQLILELYKYQHIRNCGITYCR